MHTLDEIIQVWKTTTKNQKYTHRFLFMLNPLDYRINISGKKYFENGHSINLYVYDGIYELQSHITSQLL